MEIDGKEYISVKEYAEKNGITISAVTQSLHGKRNKSLLEGHVVREGNVRGGKIWLDREAVRILDANRTRNPVVIDSVQSQREHQVELKAKDARIAELEDQLAKLIEANSKLSDTVHKITTEKAALEDKSVKVDQLTLQLTDSQKMAEDFKQAAAASEKEKEELEAKIEELKHRSLWQRIRNKGFE